MKTIGFTIILIAAAQLAVATGGERPTTNTQQQVTMVELPQIEAVVSYTGGDTLFVWLENESSEKVQLKIMADGITLFSDQMIGMGKHQRAYILSQFPAGTYEIRFKKGTYVIDNTINKKKISIVD